MPCGRPVDTLKYQVDTIIKYGKVARPAIGISYVSAAQARAMGVQRGVLILDVPKGSPAERAGLKGSYRRGDGEVGARLSLPSTPEDDPLLALCS